MKWIVLPALLALAACAPEVRSTPPAERFAPVEYPAVPEGEALCEGVPCLSDREAGTLIDALIDALDAANGRLLWLRDFYAPE